MVVPSNTGINTSLIKVVIVDTIKNNISTEKMDFWLHKVLILHAFKLIVGKDNAAWIK